MIRTRRRSRRTDEDRAEIGGRYGPVDEHRCDIAYRTAMDADSTVVKMPPKMPKSMMTGIPTERGRGNGTGQWQDLLEGGGICISAS